MPLVGRGEELERLRARPSRPSRRDGADRLDPRSAGIGKSRLVRSSSRPSSQMAAISRLDVASRTAHRDHVLAVACRSSPTSAASTPSPQFSPTPRTRTSSRAPPRGDGAPTTGVPSNEVFWAVRRLLERISERRPLLVVFEDLHWAEPTMLDLVEYIAAFARGLLVLLGIARPELLETARPCRRQRPARAASDAEMGSLVEALGVEDADLRRRITSTSEGNPLFAEQLAAMIADSDPGAVIELPASIHALPGGTTIAGLNPAERRAGACVAMGRSSWPRCPRRPVLAC